MANNSNNKNTNANNYRKNYYTNNNNYNKKNNNYKKYNNKYKTNNNKSNKSNNNKSNKSNNNSDINKEYTINNNINKSNNYIKETNYSYNNENNESNNYVAVKNINKNDIQNIYYNDLKKYNKIRQKKVNNYIKKSNKKRINSLLLIFIILISIFIILLGIVFISDAKNDKNSSYNIKEKEEVKINYLDYYYPLVVTMNDKKIYKLENEEFIEIGLVSMNVNLSLNKDEYLEKGYFKIKDTEYYIDYKNLKEALEEENNDLSWKNYIPYNESIVTIDKTNLYQNDKIIYTINESLKLPIIIKKNNYYGVIFKDNLYYVLKDECSVVKENNTELGHTDGFPALVYHATYDHTNLSEKEKCLNANSTICLSDIQFEKQMKYLKDNNYYTATMKDVEMFIDGEVQLPKKTVVITIDDGYYLDAAVKVLEKCELHATLFLIGALADLDEWKTESFYSSSIELHSHTYNKHTPGVCSGGQGSILKCGNKEELLADLKKSREQLNGSTVFCYPFFEYNDYAINVLKEAGFTMAFAGGRQKIRVGSNKMKLPRYGIINTSTLDDFIRIVN